MLIGDFIRSLSQLKMRLSDKVELQRAMRALTDEDYGLTPYGVAVLTRAAALMAAKEVEPHNMAAVLASPIMSRRPAPMGQDPLADVVELKLQKAS